MAQHDFLARLGYLRVAVIIEILAQQRQSVALQHPHFAEGLEGVGVLKEIGAVAIEHHAVVMKRHVADEYLHVGVFVEVV